MRVMRGVSFSRILRAIALVITAALGIASPTYAKGNDCLFQSKGLSANFQDLNPGSEDLRKLPVLGAYLVGDCAPGQRMVIAAGDGKNFNGTRNLLGDTGDLIPYSLEELPQTGSGPGNGEYVPFFTFFVSISWSAYADASAGSYSDSVIISVTP